MYSVGKFAKLIGVSVSTLRSWDKLGLIKANRTPTNRRCYTEKQFQEYLKSIEKQNTVSKDINLDK